MLRLIATPKNKRKFNIAFKFLSIGSIGLWFNAPPPYFSLSYSMLSHPSRSYSSNYNTYHSFLLVDQPLILETIFTELQGAWEQNSTNERLFNIKTYVQVSSLKIQYNVKKYHTHKIGLFLSHTQIFGKVFFINKIESLVPKKTDNNNIEIDIHHHKEKMWKYNTK